MLATTNKKKGDAYMLLSFSCSNFCSIRDRAELSMIANSDNAHEESLIRYEDSRVLRTAAIYGPNGSGKSKLIESLAFMQRLVLESVNVKPEKKLRQSAHKLSQPGEPSQFSVQFTAGGIRYAYGFSILDGLVDEEYLYYFPSHKKSKIFERKGMDVIANKRLKSRFKTAIDDVLKENRLFLSCAANFSNVDSVMAAYYFFSEDLVFYSPEKNDDWRRYMVETIEDDPEQKDRILEIFQRFGTGIQDFHVAWREVSSDGPRQDTAAEGVELLQDQETPKTRRVYRIQLQYKEFETNLRSEESKGIQRLFEIIGPVLDVLDNGRTLIFDEIEDGLHERIVWELVQMFLHAREDSASQLIFSTHDTSLLDLNLLRRDQIWFTELDQFRATKLYSLCDIKNVRKDENISKGYIAGKYGAIPMLNRDLAQNCRTEV